MSKPSNVLANGAIILDEKRHPDGTGIVLAYWPEHAFPYVVWKLSADGSTYLGHYFSDYDRANRDYAHRYRQTASVFT